MYTRAECGIVFSDGTKNTQVSQCQPGLWGCWWPVLYVPDASNPYQIVAYCQEQALSGGRAWPTHPSRVVRLRGATCALYNQTKGPEAPLIDYTQTSSVVITELTDDEEEEDWNIVQ